MDSIISHLTSIDINTIFNTIAVTIVVPACVAVIKRELDLFFEDLSTYMNRKFDNDGDPGIGCECFVEKGTTGTYKKITVMDYTFHIFASKREVITMQQAPSGGDDCVIIVPYTYAQWRDILKGSRIKSREEVLRSIRNP